MTDTQGLEGQADSATTEGGAAAGGHPPNTEVDFKKLLRQKAEWKQRATGLESTVGDLQQQVAELRGHMQSQQTPSSSYPSSFQDMTPDQLREAYNMGVEQASPDAQMAAMRELARREAAEMVSQAKQEGMKEVEHRQLRDQVFGQIHQDFGQNGQLREDDPVVQAASQLAGGLKEIYGADYADRNPHLAQFAFLMADKMVNGPKHRQQLQDMQNQLDQLKRQQAMVGRGGGPVTQPSDEVREAVKGRDFRKAIASTHLAKKLRGEI